MLKDDKPDGPVFGVSGLGLRVANVGAFITTIGFWGDAGESLSTKSETKDDICILKECVYTRVKKISITCCK